MMNKVKMSLFGQYIKEREAKDIVEDHRGFATYYLAGNHMYIEDIFVSEEHRESGAAKDYANAISAIALKQGINKLLGSVQAGSPGATRNLKVLLAYGYSLLECQGQTIYFEKDLGDGKLSLIKGESNG